MQDKRQTPARFRPRMLHAGYPAHDAIGIHLIVAPRRTFIVTVHVEPRTPEPVSARQVIEELGISLDWEFRNYRPCGRSWEDRERLITQFEAMDHTQGKRSMRMFVPHVGCLDVERGDIFDRVVLTTLHDRAQKLRARVLMSGLGDTPRLIERRLEPLTKLLYQELQFGT